MNEETDPKQNSHEPLDSATVRDPMIKSTERHPISLEAERFLRDAGIRRQKALLRKGARRDAMNGPGRSGGYQWVVWP
jgi:hypothetical protein